MPPLEGKIPIARRGEGERGLGGVSPSSLERARWREINCHKYLSLAEGLKRDEKDP